MKLRSVFFAVFLFAYAGRACAQSYDSQRTQVFLTNVISNALISGVGGAINKNDGEKVYKAFIRNFLKGGLGGLVKYSAKYQTFYFGNLNNVYFIPFNRLYYFLGHSMVMNACYNKKLLETYYCNLYGFDIRYTRNSEKKANARLSVATVIRAASFGVSGFRFNLYRSLETGLLYFDMSAEQSKFSGFAEFNSVSIREVNGFTNYNIIPHELVHTYQIYDFFSLSSLYNNKINHLYKDKSIFKKLSKYLILDYEVFFFKALYEAQPTPKYYKNYFEFEAEHFRSRYRIKR